MKRFLVCFAALALCAVDRNDATAQQGSGMDYQTILSQVQVPSFDQVGTYGPGGYANANGVGYSSGSQQSVVPGHVQSPPAPAGKSLTPVDPYPGQSSFPSGAASNGCGGGCGAGCGCGNGSSLSPAGCGGNVYNPIFSGRANSTGGGCGTGGSVYSPGQNFGNSYGGAGFGSSSAAFQADCASEPRHRNFFFGLNGLIFDRDYEDDVFLTRNPAGDRLLSTDADAGTLGGMEFFFGSRNDSGNGWELRYWGLFADEASYSLAGASFVPYDTRLQDLFWPANGSSVYDVFSQATLNTITRDNEFHNVEANMLRRGGCFTTRSGRCASYELLSGFRWLEFDEEFRWAAFGPAPPSSLFFNTEVQNTLLGCQLGGRSEVCLTQRMRLNVGTKFGVFNNRIRANQVITDGLGSYATVGVGGTNYNYRDSKNDVSLLGELNVGSSFSLNQCSRLVVGYRAIGVSGIALAPDQFNNFNFGPAIRSIQSNNDLILHGSFFGLEFCR